MSKIEAIPYRTPACSEHRDRNEDDVCPWCVNEANEAIIKQSQKEIDLLLQAVKSNSDKWEAVNLYLQAKNESLQAQIREYDDLADTALTALANTNINRDVLGRLKGHLARTRAMREGD